MKKSIIVVAISSLALYGLIFIVSPDRTTLLAAAAGIIAALFFIVIAILEIQKPKNHKVPWIYFLPLSIIFLAIPVFFAVVLFNKGTFSVLLLIVMVSLAFSFFYNFLNIPLAVYHKYKEKKQEGKPSSYFPSISIIVPAYNEEKCIAGTLETLIEAYYPDKEIIVVDDGSTDRTFEIAQTYVDQGVKVIRRPNGGKAAALNHGLKFVTGEIMVCVDADSMVGRTSLVEMMRKFEDPAVVAVAGNIKVLNRKKFIAGCQALEYIFDINIARRALDMFGAVIVVPGCLGAFRTEALRNSAGWDTETVVEDFDTTIKIFKGGAFDEYSKARSQDPDIQATTKGLKSGKVVQASSAAVGYTEAPETIRDLWKQRQRWYRGNFQTLFKHRDAFINARYGALYSLSFPYIAISMLFIPLSMIAVTVTAIMAIMDGYVWQLLMIFGVFTILQVIISILAIELDDEDLKLAWYAPFFVLGYKHLLDFIKMKAFFDVLTKQKMGWDKLERIGLYPKPKEAIQ
jgi:cellulose synthase/poly-beta-1,6-N-acetylglucosamine synthase-like glycosyltransferase